MCTARSSIHFTWKSICGPHLASGRSEASELWRGKQLEYSFRRALMKKYQDFNHCTAQALRFVCAQFGISLSEETLQELDEPVSETAGLSRMFPRLCESLEARGFKIVACSNGTESAVRGLLESCRESCSVSVEL